MGMGKEFRSGSDSGEVIRPESLFGPAAYKGTEIGSVSVPEFGEANCQKPCCDAGNVDPRNVASVCSPEKEPLFQIVTRYDFSDVTYLLEVRHPLLARASRPGQFVIVQSHEHGERIPLTIADFDHQKGTITLVIQAVGKTTKEMQRTCVEGARLFALVGPMGHPTRIGNEMKVVCVGGGLGVAPVFPQLRAFKEKGAYVIGVVGFRSRSLIFWEEKFRKYCDELIVCTDDGSAGTKGFVTDGLKKTLQQHTDVDQVIAIGPPVMMRACAELTRPHKVKTIVSLNPIMVDGTGMCGGCRVSVGGKMRFACVDGPDFDAHEVDFDELMRRQRRFVEDEKHALNEWLKNIQAPNTASPIEAVSKVDDPSARCAGVNQTDDPAL